MSWQIFKLDGDKTKCPAKPRTSGSYPRIYWGKAGEKVTGPASINPATQPAPFKLLKMVNSDNSVVYTKCLHMPQSALNLLPCLIKTNKLISRRLSARYLPDSHNFFFNSCKINSLLLMYHYQPKRLWKTYGQHQPRLLSSTPPMVVSKCHKPCSYMLLRIYLARRWTKVNSIETRITRT